MRNISEDIMKQQREKNWWKPYFSKRCPQHVAGGKLALTNIFPLYLFIYVIGFSLPLQLRINYIWKKNPKSRCFVKSPISKPHSLKHFEVTCRCRFVKIFLYTYLEHVWFTYKHINNIQCGDLTLVYAFWNMMPAHTDMYGCVILIHQLVNAFHFYKWLWNGLVVKGKLKNWPFKNPRQIRETHLHNHPDISFTSHYSWT